MTVTAVPQLYLASASPRRRELLAQIGVRLAVLPQQVDETVAPGEEPASYVLRIARAKAAAAMQDPARQPSVPVLSADTSVVLDGKVFGKPANFDEAAAMLTQLAGRTHQVLTAVVVRQQQRSVEQVVETAVTFRPLTAGEIAAYWQSGEPRDKAGGYAIQGRAAMFVQHLSGSYSNVVGLPLFETAQLLSQFGLPSEHLLAVQS